jgi:hypothetical protein
MDKDHRPDEVTEVDRERDFPSATRILMRPAVSSAIYRAALGTYGKACLGFLFGLEEERNAPRFDFALTGVVMHTFEGVDYVERLRDLEALLPVARRFAKEIDKGLLGIWAAWPADTVEEGDAHLSALTGFATSAGISWVLEAPTDGWETILGLRVFCVQDFPRRALPYRKTKRRVYGSKDNPRRIGAMWKKTLGRDIGSS